MINVSVMYPNESGAKFDMDYYLGTHMPMVQDKLGTALKAVSVDEGLSAGEPGSEPAYVAICHLHFDSVESFQQAFEPHAAAILDDIPNYTEIEPVIQINEIRNL